MALGRDASSPGRPRHGSTGVSAAPWPHRLHSGLAFWQGMPASLAATGVDRTTGGSTLRLQVAHAVNVARMVRRVARGSSGGGCDFSPPAAAGGIRLSVPLSARPAVNVVPDRAPSEARSTGAGGHPPG